MVSLTRVNVNKSVQLCRTIGKNLFVCYPYKCFKMVELIQLYTKKKLVGFLGVGQVKETAFLCEPELQ